MIWLITVLLSVVLSARAQEPKDATSPLHEDEKVYFVIHGNPFMGYYSGKNVGFRAFREDHPLADVVDAWKNVTKQNSDVPGGYASWAAHHSGDRQYRTTGRAVWCAGVRDSWESYDALIWSSPKLNLQNLKREPLNLPPLDQSIIQHEAVARALEYKVAEERRRDAPRFVHPDGGDGIRITTFGLKDFEIVVAEVALFIATDHGKEEHPQQIVLFYSRDRRQIEGRRYADANYWFFRVEGDHGLYIVYDAAEDCDGATVASVTSLFTNLGRHIDPADLNSMSVWCY